MLLCNSFTSSLVPHVVDVYLKNGTQKPRSWEDAKHLSELSEEDKNFGGSGYNRSKPYNE